MLPKNYGYHKEMDKAIGYLAVAFHNSGHNSKPVILHSIRVGLKLYEEGYSKDIVIAGILHDILEDTDTTYQEVESAFGSDIALIVKANSFERSIKDKVLLYKLLFDSCIKQGRESLIVKAADIMDNSNYIELVTETYTRNYLIEKIRYFLTVSKEIIGKERVWNELNERLIEIEFKRQ